MVFKAGNWVRGDYGINLDYYQFFRNPGDYVGIVHSPPVIGPYRSDVHAGLVIPVGQETI